MKEKRKNYNKTCHFCLHNRPRKKDLCFIHKIYVKDTYTYTCSDFKLDDSMVRFLEEEKAEEEPELQFFYLNFNSYICS